jgi:hypothetical protein
MFFYIILQKLSKLSKKFFLTYGLNISFLNIKISKKLVIKSNFLISNVKFTSANLQVYFKPVREENKGLREAGHLYMDRQNRL